MRRLALCLFLLLFPLPVLAAYSGPGDTAAAAAWWGLRAYSGAVAAGNQALINVINETTGETCDITVSAAGGLGETANCSGATGSKASSDFCGTACKIVIWYDQTGMGFNISQSTDSARATLTFNCNNNLPCATFAGNQVYSNTAGLSIPQPFSISFVAQLSSGIDGGNACGINGGSQEFHTVQLYYQSNSNLRLKMDGTEFGLVFRQGDGFPQNAVVGVWNNATSEVALNQVVSGSNTITQGIGTSTGFTGNINVGGNCPAGGLVGTFYEGGIWASAFSSDTINAVVYNECQYWGCTDQLPAPPPAPPPPPPPVVFTGGGSLTAALTVFYSRNYTLNVGYCFPPENLTDQHQIVATIPLVDGAGNTATIVTQWQVVAPNPQCNKGQASLTASGTLPSNFDPTTAALATATQSFPTGYAGSPASVSPSNVNHAPQASNYVQMYDVPALAVVASVPDTIGGNLWQGLQFLAPNQVQCGAGSCSLAGIAAGQHVAGYPFPPSTTVTSTSVISGEFVAKLSQNALPYSGSADSLLFLTPDAVTGDQLTLTLSTGLPQIPAPPGNAAYSLPAGGTNCYPQPLQNPCAAAYFMSTWQCRADQPPLAPIVQQPLQGGTKYNYVILCPDVTGFAVRNTLPLTLNPTGRRPLPASNITWFLDQAELACDPTVSSPSCGVALTAPIETDFSFYDKTQYPDNFSDFESELNLCALRSHSGSVSLLQDNAPTNPPTGQCIIGLANNNFVDYDTGAIYAWSTFAGCSGCNGAPFQYPNIQWFIGKVGQGPPADNGCPSPPAPRPKRGLSGSVFMPPNAGTTEVDNDGFFYGANDAALTPPVTVPANSPVNAGANICNSASAGHFWSAFTYLANTNIVITAPGPTPGSYLALDPAKTVFDAGNGLGPEWPLVYAVFNWYGAATETNDPTQPGSLGLGACAPLPGVCPRQFEEQVYIQYLGWVTFGGVGLGCAQGMCFDPSGLLVATSAPTGAGGTTLNFAANALPSSGLVGDLVIDQTAPSAIPNNTTVSSASANSVSMSASAAGPIGAGDLIAIVPASRASACPARAYNTRNLTTRTGMASLVGQTNVAFNVEPGPGSGATNQPGAQGIGLPGGYLYAPDGSVAHGATLLPWMACGHSAHTTIRPNSDLTGTGWTISGNIASMLNGQGGQLYPLPSGSLPPP